MKQYYNYIYLDPRKPGKYEYQGLDFCLLYEPFYVGKGTGKRYLDHIKEKITNKRCNKLKINKIRKILNEGYKLEDYIIVFNHTINEEGVLLNEVKIINLIGRINLNTGTLLNIQDGGEGNKGTVNCRDINGTLLTVSKEEFDKRDDLVGSTIGMISCKDVNGNTFQVSKEEFDKRDDLVGVNKGIKQSKELILKRSSRNSGENHSKVHKTFIYNEKDELMFECNISINKFLKDHNLPPIFLKSRKLRGFRIYENMYTHDMYKIINNGNIQYRGWYALKDGELQDDNHKSYNPKFYDFIPYKRYGFYNEKDELMFENNKRMHIFCLDNDLPEVTFLNSLKTNKGIYSNQSPTNKSWIKYKGWYIKELE